MRKLGKVFPPLLCTNNAITLGRVSFSFGRRRSDIRDRTRVFFDVEIDNQYAGRINIELFDEVVPRTVENFRSIATGKKALAATHSHQDKNR